MCAGGALTTNKTEYFLTAIQWAANLTAPGGSAVADLVQSNVGNSILVASLLSALGGQGTARCSITSTGICQLSEVGNAVPLVAGKASQAHQHALPRSAGMS